MNYNGCDCNDNDDYHYEGHSNNSSKIIMLNVSANMSKNGLDFYGDFVCVVGGDSGYVWR